MRKVALIRNSRPYDFGGAELFSISIAKILIRSGHEPIIVSAHAKTLGMAEVEKLWTARSPWWSFQNFSGFRVTAFPLYLLWTLFLSIWYLVLILRSRIDVVHPQSRDDFIATTIAGKVARRKVIWFDHADLKHIYKNYGVWYKNPVGKLAYFVSRYADRIVIESHSEKRLIEESLGKMLPNNYSVTHIGVVDSYEPSARKNGPITLISTSRLVIDKGIMELIEAMKMINNPDINLKICGDGPDAKHFKQLAKNVSNIKFLGHVNDVVSALQDADIFVHPTYHEGFGLSLVEAEMCGLPIIASDVGSIPEIVKDGVSGILVPPKSAKDLADAINLLIQNPKLRARMGKAGRQIFLENFQFDKIVKEQIIPLYNEHV